MLEFLGWSAEALVGRRVQRDHRRRRLRRLPPDRRAGLGRRDGPPRGLDLVPAARPPLHDRDLRALRPPGRGDRAGGGVRPRPHRAEDARDRGRRRPGPAASQRGAQVGDLRPRLRRAGLDRRRRPHRRVQSGGGGDVRPEPRRGARPAGQRGDDPGSLPPRPRGRHEAHAVRRRGPRARQAARDACAARRRQRVPDGDGAVAHRRRRRGLLHRVDRRRLRAPRRGAADRAPARGAAPEREAHRDGQPARRRRPRAEQPAGDRHGPGQPARGEVRGRIRR